VFAAEEDLLAAERRSESTADVDETEFEALDSEASFDRVLYDGGEFSHEGEVAVGSAEEMDFLGIPGLLEPDQVATLLKHARANRATRQPGQPSDREPEQASTNVEAPAHEQRSALRRELNGLVAAWH